MFYFILCLLSFETNLFQKTNFSQPFFTFWDRILGTQWTGGDVSVRYARSSALAEKLLQQDRERELTAPEQSTDPYTVDSDSPEVKKVENLKPIIPSTPPKAQRQAAASRVQILEDKENGGVDVLYEEAAEERREEEFAQNIRRSPRKKNLPNSTTTGTTGSQPSSDGFRGLKERVNGSLHGRAGSSVLGMDKH
jgi:sphinganine C4-monooxygenase